MTTSNLLRASGLAAIVAGMLRAIASFVPDSVPYAERQILYGLTDAFIIFGIIGAYSWRHREAGLLGFCGLSWLSPASDRESEYTPFEHYSLRRD